MEDIQNNKEIYEIQGKKYTVFTELKNPLHIDKLYEALTLYATEKLSIMR